MGKWFYFPYLETQTKDSNVYASKRVENSNVKLKLKRHDLKGAAYTGHNPLGERSECKNTCWDPKYCELCLNRVNPGETLGGSCSNYNMQINHQIWV